MNDEDNNILINEEKNINNKSNNNISFIFDIFSQYHSLDDANSGNYLDNQFDVFNSLNNENILIYIRNKGDNKSIVCYNIDTCQKVYSINNISKSKIKCIKHYILDKRDIFIICSYDNTIQFYDLYIGIKFFEIKNAFVKKSKKYKNFCINSFCLFFKEKNIFLISEEFYDKNLTIWEISKNSKNYEIKNIEKINDITNIYYLDIYSYYDDNEKKNINLIITCGYKTNIKFLDFETKTIYKEYNTKKYDCRSVKIGGINKKYVICNKENGLIIFDFYSTQLVNYFDFNFISNSGMIYNNRYFFFTVENLIRIIDLNDFTLNKLSFCFNISDYMKDEKITDLKIINNQKNENLLFLHNYPYILFFEFLIDIKK